MTAEATRPLPEETAITAPFWQAARERRLVIQRCGKCGRFRWPPEIACYECGSLEYEWAPVSGRATLYTWTVAHPPLLTYFQQRSPWPVAVVEQSPVLVLVPAPVFPILAVADQLDPKDCYRLALPSLGDSMSSWFLVVAVAANLPNRWLKQQFHPSWISHCCGRAEMLRSGQQLLIPGQQRR